MTKILKFFASMIIGYIYNFFYIEYDEENNKIKLKFGFFFYLLIALLILKVFNLINLSYLFIVLLTLSPMFIFLLIMFVLSGLYSMYIYFKLM